MTNHEWRVLPLTNWLKDEYGLIVFLFLHIPLFAGLVALVASHNNKVRHKSQICISAFLVIHAILHTFFSAHSKYEFTSTSSNVLIYGGAILGIAYFLFKEKNQCKTNT